MRERRLGGWGFTGCEARPSAQLMEFLRGQLGVGDGLPEAEVARFALPKLKSLPKFPAAAVRSAWARVFYCLGQSFPDLFALRTASQTAFPEAVLLPTTPEEVQKALNVAAREGLAVIPRGGGTSVVGGVSVEDRHRPVVVMALERLRGMESLDGRSGLATFLAGTSGPEVEQTLSANGFWLGHEPQSFELSTVGGWVATRSAGHRSTGIGKIEDLVAGLEVALPSGIWRLPAQPASAMGPEFRRVFCGSEGRLGVITKVTLRLRPRRNQDPGAAFLLPSFSAGLEVCRNLLQRGWAPEVVRLSDAVETAFALRLANLGRLASVARDLLVRWRPTGCLLLLGFGNVPYGFREMRRMLRAHDAIPLGVSPWEQWKEDRFLHPYFRDWFLSSGYGVDTFETAAPWSALERLYQSVRGALEKVADGLNQRVVVLCHLSHAYKDGACLYFTFFWPLTPSLALEHWRAYKEASVEALLALGGTVSHHHGVGRMHTAYWPKEVGEEGVRGLQSLVQAWDPQGVLNPGALLP